MTKRTEGFAAFFEASESSDLQWRAGRSASELEWLNLLVQLVFGRLHDFHLRCAIKMGKSPQETLEMPVFQELWQPVEEKFAAEYDEGHADGSSTAVADANDASMPADEDDVAFVLPASEEGQESRTVKISQVQCEKRIKLETLVRDARTQLKAQLHFVAVDPETEYEHGLGAELMKAAAFQRQGMPSHSEPELSRYVGIFFDVKLSGEPSHRPNLRVAGLRQETFSQYVSMVMKRHVPADAEPCIGCGDLFSFSTEARTFSTSC